MSRWIAWTLALSVMLAAAILAARGGLAAGDGAPRAAGGREPDLVRCRDAGHTAAADPACRAAWDAARARFFGRAAS